MRGRAAGCWCLLAFAAAVGQTVHHAVPSERFPTAWYPADNDVTSTEMPVTGAPYEARRVTDGQSGSGTRVARDSAGRVREEELQPRPGPDGSVVEAHQVMVSDPVSHCSFQWMEPWAASGPPTATVSCMTPTLHYSGQSMWAKVMASAAGEDPSSPGETVRNEPLGERVLEGVRASGLRSTTTVREPRSGARQSSTTEIWWSSELKEIIGLHNSAGYGTELRDIVRREPDAALFYPPAGYRIRVLGMAP